MAQTLLAFLLVNSSAKGPNLTTSRFSRPLPYEDSLELDNPWRAANHNDSPPNTVEATAEDYQWKSLSSHPGQLTHCLKSTFSTTTSLRKIQQTTSIHRIFDYSTQFLAGMLCPKTSTLSSEVRPCNRRPTVLRSPSLCRGRWSLAFQAREELVRFKGKKLLPISETSNHAGSPTGKSDNSWLHMFHFVLVLDLPDASSSASGNMSKYLDTIYKQIVFTITAVLFQEQVLSNFVELECDVLGSLEAEYIAKGPVFCKHTDPILIRSSKGNRFPRSYHRLSKSLPLHPAMKALFDAIKSSYRGLQLPPFLDHLLQSEEHELDFVDHREDDDEARVWGCDLSFGWRLPSLAPWKSPPPFGGRSGAGSVHSTCADPHVSPDERDHAEGLIRFLETASVTLSPASPIWPVLLDWDMETQIYPTVRWLVHHRRAKVVDTVHSDLKDYIHHTTRYLIRLSTLSAEFKRDFPQAEIPPLPYLLASISEASSRQSDNHFFAVVVRSKELIPIYHEVVIWLLKRDILFTLHLRVRIVATTELKARVRQAHELKLERSRSLRHQDRIGSSLRPRDQDPTVYDANARRPSSTWFPLSPQGHYRFPRRMPSAESESSKASETSLPHVDEDDEEAITDESDDQNIAWGSSEDTLCPSLISDPGTASPLERRWLAAMSEGKDEHIRQTPFPASINQYFDGKSTDDEILYRAEISRKQLREVLHHYDEYLQTFLHPA
ncbi:hypothetical protein EDC04DRAFT_2868624 [Pisolithus marmoratus]|nr:hypothetical protein EDC04DRAFT_2868624 [Pisolithus marmoratus]